MGIKYPEVEVQIVGEDGNAFAIVGAVRKALRQAGAPRDELMAFTKEATGGANVLKAAMRWVNVC